MNNQIDKINNSLIQILFNISIQIKLNHVQMASFNFIDAIKFYFGLHRRSSARFERLHVSRIAVKVQAVSIHLLKDQRWLRILQRQLPLIFFHGQEWRILLLPRHVFQSSSRIVHEIILIIKHCRLQLTLIIDFIGVKIPLCLFFSAHFHHLWEWHSTILHPTGGSYGLLAALYDSKLRRLRRHWHLSAERALKYLLLLLPAVNLGHNSCLLHCTFHVLGGFFFDDVIVVYDGRVLARRHLLTHHHSVVGPVSIAGIYGTFILFYFVNELLMRFFLVLIFSSFNFPFINVRLHDPSFLLEFLCFLTKII